MVDYGRDCPRNLVNLIGHYGHFGYRLKPKLEGIFRFDSWDPDLRRETNATNVTERDFVAGFNYFVKENQVKLQFNYLHKDFRARHCGITQRLDI